MRLYSFVAAAALLTASLAAHADTITQSFAVPFDYSAGDTTTYDGIFPATPFNPALGILNSVSIAENGSITLAGTPFNAGTDVTFNGQVINSGFSQGQYFLHDGTYNVAYGATSTDPFVLQSVERPNLVYFADVYGQYLTNANVTATLTYNYTAVAATPEPSSLALLGTGLLGAVGVMRKRFA